MKMLSLLVLLALVGMACSISVPAFTIGSTTVPTSLPTLSPTPLWTSTPAFTPTATLPPTEIVSFTPSPAMVEAVPPHTVNCRFGPGGDFLPVGTLPPGQWVPINASLKDQSWWRIELPSSSGTYCWISSSLTQTKGDLSQVDVMGPPGANAIGATVTGAGDLIGLCSGSNTNTFTGTITSNGPGEILYVWEIANQAGERLDKGTTQNVVFHTSGTLAVNPWSFTGGCGNYVVSLVIFNPNSLVATFSYTVVSSTPTP